MSEFEVRPRRGWGLALRLMSGAGLLGLALWYADGAAIMTRLRMIDPWLSVLAFVLLLVGQWLHSWRWRWLLQAVQPDPPPVRQLFALMLVGMFFSFMLPTTVGGDVVRAEMTQSRVGGRANAYASILVARILGLLSVLTIGALMVAGAYALTGWHDAELTLTAVLAALPVILFATWMAMGSPVGSWRLPAPTRLATTVARVLRALKAYASRPVVLWRVLLMAIVANALGTVGVVWALAAGLGLAVPAYYHFIAVPLATLITTVPVSVNGIGVREAAYAYLYAKAGADVAAAVSLSLAFTAVLALLSLLGGLFLLLPGAAALPPRRTETARTTPE